MSTDNPTATSRDYLLLLLLATLWGASYTFIRVGVETIPPVTFIAARTVIAGSVLLLILRLRRVSLPLDVKTLRLFAFQALMNSVVPFTLIAWAETTIEAGLATILNSTTPVFTFLITWAVTRHEPATGRKLFGVAAGLAGITLVIGVGALGGLGKEVIAQLAVVLSSVCYAIAAIFGRHFKGFDPMVPAAGSLLTGAAVLVPLSLALDHPWTLQPSWASLGALVGLSVFSTALAFVLYFRLLHRLGSVGTSAQAYLRVPIGVVIGMVLLGEALSGSAYLGLALVVAGVAAMTLPARTKQPA